VFFEEEQLAEQQCMTTDEERIRVYIKLTISSRQQ